MRDYRQSYLNKKLKTAKKHITDAEAKYHSSRSRRLKKEEELRQKRMQMLTVSKRIAAVLRGLGSNTITRASGQKKYYRAGSKEQRNTWKPLLLKNAIVHKNETGEQLTKKIVYETSIVTRFWDKEKARQMVSSGPSIIKKQRASFP